MTTTRKRTKSQRAVDMVLSAEGRMHIAMDAVAKAHRRASDLLAESNAESYEREAVLLERLTVESTIRNTNRLLQQDNEEQLGKIAAFQGQL